MSPLVPRLKLATSTYAEDSNGNGVLMVPGDLISNISDAGPIESIFEGDQPEYELRHATGWNVSFKFIPKHGLWTEIVTMDAVKLLKALEGQE